jgi:hypothetical protein
VTWRYRRSRSTPEKIGLKLEEMIAKEGYDINQVQESDDKGGLTFLGGNKP